MLKYLQKQESLRVLDIGPTSSANINFVTGLGHSIYMSNVVEEAGRPEWNRVLLDDQPTFPAEEFLENNLALSGRSFDAVLLWDAADFLPEALLPGLLRRLYDSLAPGGQMLSFFHAKPSAATNSAPGHSHYVRYHLTATDNLEAQQLGTYPMLHCYNNRQIESLLKNFSNYRFFLAKDNIREVLATR